MQNLSHTKASKFETALSEVKKLSEQYQFEIAEVQRSSATLILESDRGSVYYWPTTDKCREKGKSEIVTGVSPTDLIRFIGREEMTAENSWPSEEDYTDIPPTDVLDETSQRDDSEEKMGTNLSDQERKIRRALRLFDTADTDAIQLRGPWVLVMTPNTVYEYNVNTDKWRPTANRTYQAADPSHFIDEYCNTESIESVTNYLSASGIPHNIEEDETGPYVAIYSKERDYYYQPGGAWWTRSDKSTVYSALNFKQFVNKYMNGYRFK